MALGGIIIEWIPNLSGTIWLLVASLIGNLIAAAAETRRRLSTRSKRKSLRIGLREEMRRMYPFVLSFHRDYRNPNKPERIFSTKQYNRGSDDIHLLTENEQRKVEALYQEIMQVVKTIDNKEKYNRGLWQYGEVEGRDLHTKLLEALNSVEEELDVEKTTPDDYDIPESEFGDAERMLG